MKPETVAFKKYFTLFTALFVATSLLFAFQNCSKAAFSDMRYLELASASSVQIFKTNEETELVVQPKTFSSLTGKRSSFTITRQPTHGVITSFDSETGKFIYQPSLKFFGDDEFHYVEQEAGVTKPHQVPIYIQVVKIGRTPSIITDTIGFEMNTQATQLTLAVTDYHDTAPQAFLSLDQNVREIKTAHGLLRHIADNRFTYTPDVNYRGNDKFEFTAKNSFGETSKKFVTLNVGNPFHNLEPSLAVRGIGCASCHLKSNSKLITDFGFGSDYFFGKNALAVGGNPLESPHSFYSDHGGASLTTAQLKEIVVPNQNLPFAVSSFMTAASANPVQAAAQTLEQYVKAVNPASTVVTKNQIFIGAPSADVLVARTGILATTETTYIKNQDSSPVLSGLVKTGSYYTATTLVCDGDLVIKGTLYIKDLNLHTNDGCRIHVTGPIFINGKITYTQQTPGTTNNTNLQLVSSTWINMGVGLSHCESNPGYPTNVSAWYRTHGASSGLTPFSHRIVTHPAKSRTGQQNGAALQSLQSAIIGFQDASCRKSIASEAPREEHFERLLLNAPRVDSRYTGQFTGVIIAETVLMSLSSFSFTFDSVFSRVPVLPLLLPTDYLVVK